MDLHVLKPECGIGIHRHRDNQEIFFLPSGTGIMVMGDWGQFPDRERSLEISALTAGSFSLLKPGNSTLVQRDRRGHFAAHVRRL
jgi:mannose-6-phosphate isomerase-like protein (cupin superfamily)